MKRLALGMAVVAALAGCAADQSPDATVEQVTAVAFRAPGPPSMTLITVVNNRTGAGGHTALVVNGSQRVIFDPAGSFRDSRVVERGDVIYGVTPGWLRAFKSAHARSSHHVVSQTVTLSPEQAEQALALVQSNGAVAGAYCANVTSHILSQLDGYEDIRRTFYPVNLMEQMAKYPGVTTDKYFENDSGELVESIAAALANT